MFIAEGSYLTYYVCLSSRHFSGAFSVSPCSAEVTGKASFDVVRLLRRRIETCQRRIFSTTCSAQAGQVKTSRGGNPMEMVVRTKVVALVQNGMRNHVLASMAIVAKPSNTMRIGTIFQCTAPNVPQSTREQTNPSQNVDLNKICGGRSLALVGQDTPVTAAFGIVPIGTTSRHTAEYAVNGNLKRNAVFRAVTTRSNSNCTTPMCEMSVVAAPKKWNVGNSLVSVTSAAR